MKLFFWVLILLVAALVLFQAGQQVLGDGRCSECKRLGKRSSVTTEIRCNSSEVVSSRLLTNGRMDYSIHPTDCHTTFICSEGHTFTLGEGHPQ